MKAGLTKRLLSAAIFALSAIPLSCQAPFSDPEPWSPWSQFGTVLLTPGAGWTYHVTTSQSAPWGFEVHLEARTVDSGCAPTQAQSALLIEYRVPTAAVSTVGHAARVWIRVSCGGGPRAVSWRNVQVYWGYQAVPSTFVPPAGPGAWGQDGAGTACGPPAKTGASDFGFVWEDTNTNGHAHIDIVDGSSDSYWDGATLTKDISRLAVGGDVRMGTAADGASRLLMRVVSRVPGTIQATIPGWLSQCGGFQQPFGLQSATAGRLIPMDSGTPQSSITAATTWTPAGHVAAFWYEAPVDFEVNVPFIEYMPLRVLCTSIQFDADYTMSGTTQQQHLDTGVVIERVPWILCHGLWSNSETWTPAYGGITSGYPTDPRIVDYRETVGRHLAQNVEVVYDAIEEAKRGPRSRGIACSRVDWIGHSMGGLLPRAYVRMSKDGLTPHGFYRRPDNMMGGDFHKLITINTPHFGSPWANFLMAYQYFASFQGPALPILIADLYRMAGLSIGDGAIEDLQEGSVALTWIGETHVPCHAIAGTGGGAVMTGTSVAASLSAWATGAGELAAFAKVVKWTASSINVYSLFRGHTHDIIVLGESQLGGLTPPHVTEFTGLDSVHTAITQNLLVRDRVVQLLRAPVGTGTANDLFASSLPSPEVALGILSPPVFPSVSAPFTTADGTVFSAPSNPIHPGDFIGIPQLVAPAAWPNEVRTIIDSNGSVTSPTMLGTTLWYSVPQNAMGPLTLRCVRENPSNGMISITPPLTVQVTPSTPTGGNVDSPHGSLDLTFVGEERIPTWTGAQAGGLTANLTGLVTLVSADTGVATIVPGNRVRAVGEGDTVVTATWLDGTATIPIHVHFHSVVSYAGASGASAGSNLTLTAGGGPAKLGSANFHLDLKWPGAPASTYLVIGSRATEQAVAGLLVLVPPEDSIVVPFPAGAAQPVGASSLLHLPLPIPNIPGLAGQKLFLQAARTVPGAWLTQSNGLRLMILP